MLKEFKRVRQVTGHLRRWFQDDYFDLIVWYGVGRVIAGFQLCYDREGSPRALTWLKDKGFTHDGIDDGELPPGRKKTPVLVADGGMPIHEVTAAFERRSQDLSERLRGLVLTKLGEYAKQIASS